MQVSYKQHKCFLQTMNNAPFEKLTLFDYNEYRKVYIDGKKVGQFKWEFSVADTLLVNSENMLLFVPEKDTVRNAFHQIRLYSTGDSLSKSTVSVGIQDEYNYIEGDYRGQVKYEDEDLTDFLNVKDPTFIGTLINNEFILKQKEDQSDIKVRTIEPYFAWFSDADYNDPESYDKVLQNYIDLAKDFSNSRYLVTYLALNLNKFNDPDHVKAVYENLKPPVYTSKWIKMIEQYITRDFVNSNLLNSTLTALEPLVLDTTRYNLITFAASWCVPCIEEIPLLNKLNKELKSTVDLTYVSIDKEKDVKAFQKLLERNKVKMRTMYAHHDLERIKNLYFVYYLPISLLIYPNGKFEILNVRREEIQNKLYSLSYPYNK